MIEYQEERLSADTYIEFLARTDLGSQYPKERFRERIENWFGMCLSVWWPGMGSRSLGSCLV